MTGMRMRSLLALLVLLGGGLVARLFQVQVLEHDVWSREASNQVFQGREEPYRRGRILAADGPVLARDEEQRSVALVYRAFRRDHPLGQVAHARSLLEGRPVPLSEARAHLADWAHELVALGPRELGALARGEAEGARTRGADARLDARRASDLFFYVQRLLALEGDGQRRQRTAFLERSHQGGEARSFLELAAEVRRGAGSEAVRAEREALDQRLAQALHDLAVLASWTRAGGRDDAPGDPLEALVAELESERRAVEDATAAKLFAEATGFAPGRIAVDTLLECFDHGWITALLGWDRRRLAEWAETVRAGWVERWRDRECLPLLLKSLALDPPTEPGTGDFLARLAVVYEPEGALDRALDEGPRPWRSVDALAVFEGLDEAFEADVPAAALALGHSALPIQLETLRSDPDDARLLPEGDGPESFRATLARSLAPRPDEAALLALAQTEIEIWDLRFQETLRRALDETRRAADRDELGPQGGLILHAANRDRAAERADYYLKDFGSRPRALSKGELTYDVIYLLTRYEDGFPGFRVRDLETRARVELEGDDVRPAERLLGRVTMLSMEDRVRQRRDVGELRRLKATPDRDEEELEELRRLIGEVRLPSQVKGVEGLEAYFEPELTGVNGYALTRGMADIFADGEIAVREPHDGSDVVLTLRTDLQTAAQRCLREPEVVGDPSFDHGWQANPVGAIVLLSRDGDVLAAASEPDDQSQILGASGERAVVAERTLTKRTFQPPGSDFKVFVAAWALDHGLDPERTVTCGPIARGGSGYKDLRCWNSSGHGPVNLHSALVQSCNAYFAWLGEQLSTRDFVELCEQFGFGRPTGVRTPPPWDDGPGVRFGLREDVAGLALPKRGGELPEALRRMAANGLGVIEATPMQVARGMLSLERGERVALRLVQRIGERELPRVPAVPLDISRHSLDFVRAAMRGVAEEAHGTARNALSKEELGFSVAVKTGSADLESRRDDNGHTTVRKHAWVAGWAPAEDPRLVFVVFEHDTEATSSHGAVFLARQLLRQPEVLRWMKAEQEPGDAPR